ncbi:restriction endonuclease subunit S [Pseudomonas donghuensis]|nr:restriction endonuclease subunit S [Pseudomonas donghuensis]
MSRIEALIAELCPEGVEFRPIGDIGELVRGNGMPKSDFVESGIGCIHYGQIYTYYGTWTTETMSFVSVEKARSLAKVDPGDLVITNTSENIEDVCKAVAWLGDKQVVTGGHATVLKHRQDSKYLSYYLQTPRFFAEKKRHATGTKVIDVSAKSLAKIRIPVPPLEIQRKIVKVLDTLTELETELETQLEAELEARRWQYKYYRDALLAFRDQDIRWAAMAEVGEFFRGRRFTKADYVEDGVPCVHYGDIYTQYGTATEETVSHVRADMVSSLRFAQPGDLIIAGVGETVEDVGKAVTWLGRDEVAIHDDCFAFRHSLNPRFVSYYFQTTAFHAEKNKFVARAKVKRLSAGSLAKLTIPVPSPEEQARIVAILDKFDALVNEISVGLPAEIAARRQQYAHYRDRLLTFKDAA